MPLYDERAIWNEIVQRAELGENEIYLQLIKPELKRQFLFLRSQNGVELPEIMVTKLSIAAESMEYHLRVTGKWATMQDLSVVVGDVSWLWRQWIPREMITVFAGDPGTSKSSLALWFCKLVTSGMPWPDGSVNTPSHCIYVDAEAAQVITKQRCINMGIDMNKIYIPNLGNDMLAQPDLNNESHRVQLSNMVDDISPGLIIVDSLGGVKSGKENDKSDIQPTMLYLTQLVQNKSCAIIVIHHLNKIKREEDEEIAIAHLRGSSAIAQFAREILFISKKPQGMQLRVGKSNLDRIPDPFLVRFIEERTESEEGYDTIIRGFSLEEWHEDVKLTKHQECEQWITDCLLNANPEHKLLAREVYELSKDEPFTLQMVKSAAAVLERRGIISRSGGKYSEYQLLQFSMNLQEVEDGDYQERERD